MQRNSNKKYCNKSVFKNRTVAIKKILQPCPFELSKIPTDSGNSFAPVGRESGCRLSF